MGKVEVEGLRAGSQSWREDIREPNQYLRRTEAVYMWQKNDISSEVRIFHMKRFLKRTICTIKAS